MMNGQVQRSSRRLRVHKPCTDVDNEKTVTHIITPLAHTAAEVKIVVCGRAQLSHQMK